MKKIVSFLAALSVLATSSVLTGCGSSTDENTAENTTAVETEANTDAVAENNTEDTTGLSADTVSDLSSEYYIKFTSSSVETNIETATVSGATVTLTEPVDSAVDVSGNCSEGQIVVNIDKEKYADSDLKLNLQNLTLSSTKTSPIYVASIGDKVEICSKSGTTNTISDGTSYVNDDSSAAAIYSKADLKFSGQGNLTVNGNCGAGIISKDDIKITNGNITVNSAGVGIKGKDSVTVGEEDSDKEITLSVTTKDGDGIKTTNSDEEGKGNITFYCGNVTVNSQGDGVQAEQNLYIYGGTVNVTAEGENTDSDSSDSNDTSSSSVDSAQSASYLTGDVSVQSLAFGGGFGGGMGGGMGGGGMNEPGISTNGVKGIKAGGEMDIEGGTISVSSNGHAVHSAGDINITGGDMTITTSTGKGITAHGNLNIGKENDTTSNPSITIENATEALESKAVMTINSGTVHINYASDDGLNTGGTESTDHSLYVKGGYVYICMNSGGDGVDSNGQIYFEGGTVVVNGPTGDGDSPVDSEEGVNYNGGTVVAVGSSGMISGDCYSTSNSTNGYVLSTSAGLSNGDAITVVDSDGKVILHYELNNEKNTSGTACNGFLASGSDFTTDGTYTVYVGGTYTGGTAVDENGLYTGGVFNTSGATELSLSTAQGGGMMGGGGMGGQTPPDGNGGGMGGGQTPPGGFGGGNMNG